MEAVADKNDSYESVKAHVKELERRHEEEIAKLYDLQTRDYLLRRLDAYHTADNAMDLPEVDVSKPRSIYEEYTHQMRHRNCWIGSSIPVSLH